MATNCSPRAQEHPQIHPQLPTCLARSSTDNLDGDEHTRNIVTQTRARLDFQSHL